MKNLYTFVAISIGILFTSCTVTRDYAQYNPSESSESPDITYQQFYDDLSPYGDWVDYQGYGYVWVPDEAGFRPYYNNGHWVYTDYGWTWASDYSWGWGPFHYGRWLYDGAYGWMWVPGYEWAPAWVSWRSGGGCYGWAPLGPGSGYGVNSGGRIRDDDWAFVPNRYITSPRINNYYITREKNVTIINNTTVINNTNITTINKTVYVNGPSQADVEKNTNERIRPVRIFQKNNPGKTEVTGSSLSIYKPAVKELPAQHGEVKPSQVVRLNDLRLRRENPGAVKNDTRENEVKNNPAVNNVPKTEVQPPQRINKIRSLNDTRHNVAEEEQPAIKTPDPVIEKQVEQTRQAFPDQRVTGRKPEIFTRPNNVQPVQNNQQNIPVIKQQQVQNNQQNSPVIKQQPVINKQPELINRGPEKLKEMNLPNKAVENNRNIQAVPDNRQPVKINQVNSLPQRMLPADERQERKPVFSQPPAAQNPNPPAPVDNRRDRFVKDNK